jgi:hypothetical protein
MWRHITGIEQPAKKIQLDNNEKDKSTMILKRRKIIQYITIR